MNAEDWSVRLPETAEWCYRVAEERGQDFNAIFPELSWLQDYHKPNNDFPLVINTV